MTAYDCSFCGTKKPENEARTCVKGWVEMMENKKYYQERSIECARNNKNSQ